MYYRYACISIFKGTKTLFELKIEKKHFFNKGWYLICNSSSKFEGHILSYKQNTV